MVNKVAIVYSVDALRDLKRLEKIVARRIVSKLEDNATQADPLIRAKPLSGNLAGKYRYRIGVYRVIFTVAEDGVLTILTILRVQHRKDVYT